METKLPKYIINSIKTHSTSLGEHPSFPPDDEDSFLLKIVNNYFNKLCDNVDIQDINGIKKELGRLIAECQKIEVSNKEALEELVVDVANNVFSIPEDTININAKLVTSIDNVKQRMLPEKTDDFEFDSIDDMNSLGDEIYKRRMLNALVCGASLYYSMNTDLYLTNLFKISPELPSMYAKILKYNNILMYFEKDTLDKNGITEAGSVDVYIQQEQNKADISAQGIIFPILLNELIKGFNELAISHGLPEEKINAEYVMKKSDFKLAEMWDSRLGLPLWDRVINCLDKIDCDINDAGINFFFMELSCLSPYDFNTTLKEIFGNTKKGSVMLKEIIDKIVDEKEQDEFDDYMNTMQKQRFQISDSEYFEPEELIADCM